MDDSKRPLQQKLNILEVFGSLSGLKMNMAKINLKWYGLEKRNTPTKKTLLC